MEVTKPLTAQCRRTALRPIHLDVLTAPNLNRIPHAFLQTKSAAQGRAVFFSSYSYYLIFAAPTRQMRRNYISPESSYLLTFRPQLPLDKIFANKPLISQRFTKKLPLTR
jgi:hypothetical protein